MKSRTRYLIFFIFFVIFFVSSVILLKYATGYHYNFKKNTWQKTGVLILESNLKDVDIFLNGELQKEKIPTKIVNLFPGDYLVKLQKANYFDWQKRLTINSNLTTFAKDIIFFKKDQSPVLLLDQNIEYFKLFLNKKKMLFFTKNKTKFDLWLFDFRTKEKEFLNSFSFVKINNISLSPSEQNVLIEGNDNLGKMSYLILNLEKPEEIVFLNEFASNIQNIKWDLKSDKILYGIVETKDKSILVQINLKNKKIVSMLSEMTNILDYYLEKKFIYYLINSENKNVFLKKISKNNSNSLKEVDKKNIQLPYSFYYFINSPANIITLLDKKNQLLYLISFQLKTQETQKIILEAKDAVWSKDQKKILYYNDLELWICYLNQEKLKESYHELLGRWSQKISKAIWHPQENYVIFTLLNSTKQYLTELIPFNLIKAIEIDGRDQRNITQILEFDLLSKGQDLFFSFKEKILYFIKDKKLYKMKIY